VLPFGSALLARRSRRHLRQSPAVTGRGSTHIDTAFMGLTSSGGVAVNCKLQARASPSPTLSQPRDHDSERAGADAGRIRRRGLAGPGHGRRSAPGCLEADRISEGAARWNRRRSTSASGAGPTSRVTGRPARLHRAVGRREETGAASPAPRSDRTRPLSPSTTASPSCGYRPSATRGHHRRPARGDGLHRQLHDHSTAVRSREIGEQRHTGRSLRPPEAVLRSWPLRRGASRFDRRPEGTDATRTDLAQPGLQEILG
jgi:hypothetical protein